MGNGGPGGRALERHIVVAVFPAPVVGQQPIEVPPLDGGVVGALVRGKVDQWLRSGLDSGRGCLRYRSGAGGRMSRCRTSGGGGLRRGAAAARNGQECRGSNNQGPKFHVFDPIGRPRY